jgi:hypothetical protein
MPFSVPCRMASRLQEIEEKILTLLHENTERMESALKDPQIKDDPAKLQVLMNMNISTLSQVYMLQQEKIATMLVEIKSVNND